MRLSHWIDLSIDRYEIGQHVPQGVQVDWLAILSPTVAQFSEQARAALFVYPPSWPEVDHSEYSYSVSTLCRPLAAVSRSARPLGDTLLARDESEASGSSAAQVRSWVHKSRAAVDLLEGVPPIASTFPTLRTMVEALNCV